MENLNTSLNSSKMKDSGAPKDPQEQYDEDLMEYTRGDGAEKDDTGDHRFSGRFPRDFYRYSQDFHDRESGAPGIDQDFGTNSGIQRRDEIVPNLMPEGGGVFETRSDMRIRQEALDLLEHDSSIDAADITVRVEDGILTLTGTVDEERMKRTIEDAVRSVPGVDEVLNSVVVNPPLSPRLSN